MDVDGELERLRAEARHRLEGEAELEKTLAQYEPVKSELLEPAPPLEAPAKPAEESRAPRSSLAEVAAERTARGAAERVSAASTPKLVAALVVLILGAIIVERLIGPIVAIIAIGLLLVLGYRFYVWFATGSDEDDED